MAQIIWPSVTVAGDKLLGAEENGVQVTPEFLEGWLESTTRPEGYTEGDVFINLKYSDLARLFGDVEITYSEGE